MERVSLRGGPMETAATPGSTAGITITANGTANVKATTWTELIASTAYDSQWLMISLATPSAGGAGYAVDIGMGASTAEVVLIPDLWYWTPITTKFVATVLLLPIAVPRGTRLSARCQSSTASATLQVVVTLIASPLGGTPGMHRVEESGVTTSAATTIGVLNDPGATPNTDGTWTEIVASTGFTYRWLGIIGANTTDSTWASPVSTLLDIGIGGSGAEVVLIPDIPSRGSTGNDQHNLVLSLPVAIPAGTRIVARHRSSSGTTGDRRLHLALYGCG